ncbi:1,4-dihydroxy-2-naphthoate octaprenyltransferase [Kingella sp. SNUBH-2017]|uniref:1,4-dihydroxy-2-naphthoate octaprenyltransferase n=1 Tax=Kingella sp. SNUBH-2017 TaxID=2994077 RepID=UPI002364352D|nr:1,4-dihydroxy-2-naphthoate octaprenyltransferase [Kingella sp. SNUBH-2017]MDD2181906.1 1,4-dihydroxy-2-naphthoate octaprenyltransferase [Kingella sp. SNUBH-2017]
MKPFFQLIRPRTLPLAVSVTLAGTALAARHGALRADVFVLALATTLLLQILSNLANDYGDGLRGTDRLRAPDAPPRLSAGGGISPQRLKLMMAATATAAVVCGLALLFAALPGRFARLVFAALGVLALAAALGYTLGHRAYGYHALGEVAVWLTFGLLGIGGHFYLQAQVWNAAVLLPACGSGLLAAAVLHTNNIRDIRSDRAAGKRTLANLLGFAAAKRLHTALAGGGLLCYAAYGLLTPAALGFLVCLPQAAGHLARVRRAPDCAAAGRELSAAVILHTLATLGLSAGLFCAAWAGWQAA